MEKEIISLLQDKSATKQAIYRKTQSVFNLIQEQLKDKAKRLTDIISSEDGSVQIEYSSNGEFDSRIKFSGDTLVFHMHSNVFDFPKEHTIYKKEYIKEDTTRAFCGIIYVYEFLSDSLKYNRMNDSGLLLARIFVNKDNHFFVEGEKQLGFLFNDIASQQVNNECLNKIIDLLMIYALEFDLKTPNFNDVRGVLVHQILNMSNNQKIKTAKRLGYKFSFETNND